MEYLLSLAVFLCLIFIILSFGARLFGISGFHFNAAAEKYCFSFGLGFAAIAYLVLALGISGLLYRAYFLGVLALVCFISYPEFKNTLSSFASALRKIRFNLIICTCFVISLILLLAALALSFSNDSMVYHLTDAKFFARNHYVGLIKNNSTNSLWPYLVEMYFTLAILFKMVPLAGLVQFSLFLASAVGIYAFAKRFFSFKEAVLSVLFFMLIPGIHIIVLQTYVDMGMVFYCLTTFYAFFIWRQTGKTKWLIISGLMSGFALSVKYFALILPVLVLILFSIEFVTRRFQRKKEFIVQFSIFIFAVLISSFVWYLRQYLMLGNPFFPFFQNIFGSSGLNPEAMLPLSEVGIRSAYGVGLNLINFLAIPWTITMAPSKFGGEQLGPLFLMAIPGIMLIKSKNKDVKIILLFIILYLSGWFLQYQNLRFVFPIVPLLSVISAHVLCGFMDKGPFFRKTLAVGIGIYAFFIVGLLFYYAMPAVRVVTGFEHKDSYLSRNERSYAISQYLNNNLSLDAKILVVNEGHTFFIDLNNEREIYHWIYEAYDKKLKSSQEVISYFKGKGFTHILFAYFPEQGALNEAGLRMTQLLRDSGFRDKYLEFIKELIPDSSNANNVRYLLYKFKA